MSPDRLGSGEVKLPRPRWARIPSDEWQENLDLIKSKKSDYIPAYYGIVFSVKEDRRDDVSSVLICLREVIEKQFFEDFRLNFKLSVKKQRTSIIPLFTPGFEPRGRLNDVLKVATEYLKSQGLPVIEVPKINPFAEKQLGER